ncbi:hypothetical protein [Clostridium sp. JNZ J1-5]
MAKGQKQYTEESKNTIVDLYNSEKSLAKLSSKYALSKSKITGWIKKNNPVIVDSDTTITAEEYKTY